MTDREPQGGGTPCQAGWKSGEPCPNGATTYVVGDFAVCEGHRRVYDLGRQIDACNIAVDVLKDVAAYARTFGDDGKVLLGLIEEPRRTAERVKEGLEAEMEDKEHKIYR